MARAGRAGSDRFATPATAAQADQHDPTIEAANRYRLAMTRIQGAAVMFMATGNGSAANDVRDADDRGAPSMAAVLSGPAPDAIKTDARMAETIGNGIIAASTDLIAMSRQLDQVAGRRGRGRQPGDASRVRKARRNRRRPRPDRVRHRFGGRTQASSNILMMVGAIALLMPVGWGRS